MTAKNKLILSAVLGATAIGLHFVSKATERKQRAQRDAYLEECKARSNAFAEWAEKTAADLDQQLEAAKFWTIVIDNDL